MAFGIPSLRHLNTLPSFPSAFATQCILHRARPLAAECTPEKRPFFRLSALSRLILYCRGCGLLSADRIHQTPDAVLQPPQRPHRLTSTGASGAHRRGTYRMFRSGKHLITVKPISVPFFHSHHCLELLFYVCQSRRRRAADSTLQHCAAHRAAQRQRRSKTHKPLFHISALLPDRLSELLLTALAQAPSVSIFKYGPGSRNGIVRALLKYPSVTPAGPFCVFCVHYTQYI